MENFNGRTRFLNDRLEEPGHAEAHEDVEHVAESGNNSLDFDQLASRLFYDLVRPLR